MKNFKTTLLASWGLGSVVIIGMMWQMAPVYADAFSSGMSAYKSSDYKTAFQFLKKAYQADPQNPRIVFYMGLSLSQMGQYQQAREAFDQVGKMLPPDDPLAVKARTNMAVITQAHMTANGEGGKASQVAALAKSKNNNNYLAYAIPNGKIVHWDNTSMPIKVYINDGSNVPGWNPDMRQLFISAMNTWQSATRNKVRFAVTYSKEKADIVVRWKRNFSHNKIGENAFQSSGNTIVRSDVEVATYAGENAPPLSYPELSRTMVHELGHAIGIQGHSPYPQDIMYWMVNDAQSGLTSRDIATMSILYKLEADVKNDSNLSTTQTQKFFQLMQTAATLQIKGNNAQALPYYQQAMQLNPNEPKLFFNMGHAFMSLGQNDKAAQSFRRCLYLDPKRTDAKYSLGVLLTNEGVTFSQKRQVDPARQRYQEAIQLFESLLSDNNAPADTQKNLEVAKHNLSILP
ncbi:MAG: tetratricopeptide repeat protein [Cyanobacteria bacterium]|nr:tetratricopeptide repeat protein [Cyanobacteriota bacterium]